MIIASAYTEIVGAVEAYADNLGIDPALILECDDQKCEESGRCTACNIPSELIKLFVDNQTEFVDELYQELYLLVNGRYVSGDTAKRSQACHEYSNGRLEMWVG
jgi:hypothetical protein